MPGCGWRPAPRARPQHFLNQTVTAQLRGFRECRESYSRHTLPALVSARPVVHIARLSRNELMTSVSATFSRSRVMPGLGLTVATLAVLTVIRLIGLKFSVVDLYFDE